jgi:hypothetical protein
MNRNVKTMIRCFIKSKHTEWDQHLPKLAMAMRTAVSETTGVSPALLNLGREIPLPIDRNLQSGLSESAENPKEVATQMPSKMKPIVDYVKTCMKKAKEKQKKYYDKTHRDVRFKINDLVYIRNHPISDKIENIAAKLEKKWIGPHKVIEVLTPVTYKLEINDSRMIPIRHVHDLKPFIARKEDGVGVNRTSESHNIHTEEQGFAEAVNPDNNIVNIPDENALNRMDNQTTRAIDGENEIASGSPPVSPPIVKKRGKPKKIVAHDDGQVNEDPEPDTSRPKRNLERADYRKLHLTGKPH